MSVSKARLSVYFEGPFWVGLYRRAVRPTGAGTWAQQAIQLQREQMKTQRKADSRARREAEQERKFALRQEKRRKKHRGHWPTPDRGIYDLGKHPGRNHAEISCRGLFSSCRMSSPI